jgi:hypothetical protein
MSFRSDGFSEKKAISEADAKPEARSNSPAMAMANIAENDGVFTVILSNISVNPHKKLSVSKIHFFS